MSVMVEVRGFGRQLASRLNPTFKVCLECGNNFEAKHADRLFCREACEAKNRRRRRSARRHAAMSSSTSHEWFSPLSVVEPARALMGGFDLDPASCALANRIIQAAEYYDMADDGLTLPWFGRVWLNPPYGTLAPKFVRKFAASFPGDVTAAVLILAVHHMTTQWFAPLAQLAPIACMPSRRLRFTSADPMAGKLNPPAHGSVILGFGVDGDAFESAFGHLGDCWRIAGSGRRPAA